MRITSVTTDVEFVCCFEVQRFKIEDGNSDVHLEVKCSKCDNFVNYNRDRIPSQRTHPAGSVGEFKYEPL